jgi:hypothetical protein
MNLYTEIKRRYNKSTENPDEECIGVPYQIRDVHGNIRRIWYEQLAAGEPALNMALWCEKPRDGYNDKISRLRRMGRDKKLKARHDAKMRELERRARRGRPKK